MDFAISSYTTSVETLLRPQYGALSMNSTLPHVLTIAQPYALPHAPIPNTLHEVHLVRKHFPFGIALEGDSGTVATALAALPRHSWIHLACHGFQKPENPIASAFALYDGPMTLSALMGTESRNAEFAFLSACQTAVGDEKVPEESVHLAAGMLAVGFKGVIGTMWSIRDEDAPVVAEAYYKKLIELRSGRTLLKAETGAAYALHEATRVLREKVGESNFVRWIPFVHYGL